MQYLLDMLKWIQSMRNPIMDNLFTKITILGEEYFAIGVLCLILWCINKKLGYVIGFSYLTSWIVNFSLKEVFHVPRPFVLDKKIIPIRPETATGFSFPSGHTQSISSISTSFGISFKKWWLYICAAVLIILVAGSRLYLGVHTLLDVSVGALVGIVWSFAASMLFSYAEVSNHRSLLLLMLIPMILGMIFIHTNDYYKIAGTFTSFIIGYFLDYYYIHYETKCHPFQQVIKFIVGMTVLLAIKFIVKELLDDSLFTNYLRYSVVGFWITVAAPLLFNKLFKKRHCQYKNT